MVPDFRVMEDVLLRRGVPERVPFYEHFLDGEILGEIQKRYYNTPPSNGEEGLRRYVDTYVRLGYDAIPFETGIAFAPRDGRASHDTASLNRGQRHWVEEAGGPIATWEDLENPDFWPEPDRALDYEVFERIGRVLPDGAKVIGGASGGPFEHASFLMGLEPLSMRVCEEPEFVEALLEKIGATLVAVAERVAPMDAVGAYRFGDDLGYKTATLLPPDVLRQYFLPWVRRVVDVVHAAGKPFVYHSCGNLEAVMDDLIDDCGIDAKHSFEDVIMPVAEAKRRWGDRVALLGGVDVDYLCRHSPTEVRTYTLEILETCAPSGGYALGSGNTITNYMPVENYLAMLEAGREFNQGC